MLQYAANNWMFHAGKVDQGLSLDQTMDDFFDSNTSSFAFWQRFWCDVDERVVLQPLQCVARFGLTTYMRHLCLAGGVLDCRDSVGRTPMTYACEHGHTSIVLILLEHGAAFSTASDLGAEPIHYATWAKNLEIVRALLRAGANPLAAIPKPNRETHQSYEQKLSNQRRFGQTPLHNVCEYGYVEILKEMLKHLRAEDFEHGPLHWAVEYSQTAIVECLLDTGSVDVNRKGKSYTF